MFHQRWHQLGAYIEDPCNSEHSGYYNKDYVHDGKKAYVHEDGEYGVIFIGEEFYAGMWMGRPHNADCCDEFFTMEAYEDQQLPTEYALWDSNARDCSGLDSISECNLRITYMLTRAPVLKEHPSSSPTVAHISIDFPTLLTPEPSPMPSREDTFMKTVSPTNDPTVQPATPTQTRASVPYDGTPVDLQPCTNVTVRDGTPHERSENQEQVTSNYYETKLYTEQKGYTFVASQDLVINEADLAFIKIANNQYISVCVFNDERLLYQSEYPYDGGGVTPTTGTAREDYYTCKNMNVQLYNAQEHTAGFVILCPTTKISRAVYPLCALQHEVYSIDDISISTVNVYAYGEDYVRPTESDPYAPFVRICTSSGVLKYVTKMPYERY